MSSSTGDPETSRRFVRWQRIAIDQLTYAQNLTLTLTIAALGYWFVLLKDKDFSPGSSAKGAMLLSLIALAISAICGLVCVINRLRDFRGTSSRARGKEDAPDQDELRGLGDVTWRLFYTQLTGFAVGVVALGLAILLTAGGKLV
jgi:hypothetical protein